MFSTLIRSKVFIGYCKQFKVPFRRNSKLQILFKTSPAESLINKADQRVIYSFPWITVAAALVKYKYTFSYVTLGCIPIVYYFTQNGKMCLFLILLGLLQLSMIKGTSNLFVNSIGRIYVKKEGGVKEVLISSINSRGKRIDRIFPINDITVCDSSYIYELMGFAFIKTENSLYKINIKNGKFLDAEICNNLFSHLSLFSKK